MVKIILMLEKNDGGGFVKWWDIQVGKGLQKFYGEILQS